MQGNCLIWNLKAIKANLCGKHITQFYSFCSRQHSTVSPLFNYYNEKPHELMEAADVVFDVGKSKQKFH